MRPPQSCKEWLRLHLLRKFIPQIIFACICICYERHNYFENIFLSVMPFGRPVRADFWEGDEDIQLVISQSLAVHWMARTSSLNCLSCRNPYQSPHSLNAQWPGPLHWIAFPVEILTKALIHWMPLPFSLKKLSLKRASSHPLPRNRLLSKICFSCWFVLLGLSWFWPQ